METIVRKNNISSNVNWEKALSSVLGLRIWAPKRNSKQKIAKKNEFFGK
jgi:hypothetical protein